MNFRPILTTYRGSSPNWVGDGFLTIGMLPYTTHVSETNPFLLSGYNAPRFFPPADRRRGVGEHPHRGFETVTIVFQGGLAHADSAGKTGTLGPGDVELEAQTEAHYLVLAAEQLREPLAMGGPFVAGSEAELEQAYSDFRRGLF